MKLHEVFPRYELVVRDGFDFYLQIYAKKLC
jgi:hypothetical protein